MNNANNDKIKIRQYAILLDKLKIHCVKEHVLSFLTDFNDTIDTQIIKHKKDIEHKKEIKLIDEWRDATVNKKYRFESTINRNGDLSVRWFTCIKLPEFT